MKKCSEGCKCSGGCKYSGGCRCEEGCSCEGAAEMLGMDEYQQETARFDLNSPEGMNMSVGLTEKVLGITGEAGEVSDKFKKIWRDKNGKISNADRDEITKELGDVLWYVAAIARYLGVSLSEVARVNMEKLESRMERGKIQGDGDDR